MAKYVISDIHGMYDKFIEMLDKIKFSEDDTLYILGDIIDRGKDSMKVYKHIIKNPNIIALKGNHELMFQEFYENNLDFNYSDWKFNGAARTKKSMYKENVSMSEFYKFVKELPFIKVVDGFILTHSTVFVDSYSSLLPINEFIKSQDEEYCLWIRSNIGGKTYRDYIHVYGHTPVQTIKEGCRDIIRINNNYYIDCGACFEGGKLSCLRLDDLKEFYV